MVRRGARATKPKKVRPGRKAKARKPAGGRRRRAGKDADEETTEGPEKYFYQRSFKPKQAELQD